MREVCSQRRGGDPEGVSGPLAGHFADVRDDARSRDANTDCDPNAYPQSNRCAYSDRQGAYLTAARTVDAAPALRVRGRFAYAAPARCPSRGSSEERRAPTGAEEVYD